MSLTPIAVKFAAMHQDSLAFHLGTTTHLSPLLMKARGLGLRRSVDFERLAVSRGCRYYQSACGDAAATGADDSVVAPSIAPDQFSNTELALALLSPCLEKSQIRLRVGAAMLASPENTVEEVARLARRERSEAIVRHIAECGHDVEPDNPFWSELLDRLPARSVVSDALPHPSRFVAMTGFTPSGVDNVRQWIRPAMTMTG